MQCSRLLYPFAWLPTSAKHHGQKVTRLSDFENGSRQGTYRSFHGDVIRRVTWSSGIPGWQKICCCRALRGFCRDSILVCIHFTHAQDHDFVLYWHIIGAGYIGHCVDGSFYFVTFQKNGKRRQIWLNAFSCKQ